jgi:hypothetical protein
MSKHDAPPPPPAPSIVPDIQSPASIQQQIEAGIQAGVTAAMARMGITTQGQAAQSADEKHAEVMKVSKPRLSHEHTLVPFISREPMGTGAAMLLVVSHRGRVVNMQRYTHPEGYDKICPKGRDPGPAGRLPEGCTMTIKAANGEKPNIRTQHLIYQTYYVRDCALYVGRKLYEGGRMTEAEQTEWLKTNPLILTPENGSSAVGSVPVADDDAAE